MASTNINIRLDQELKERSFPIIESYGMTAAQAFKLFLNQIAETRTLPLRFDYHRDSGAQKQNRSETQESESRGGAGDLMRSYFENVPAPETPEEDFILPARQTYAPVDLE